MEKLKCEGGGVAKLTENAPYIFFFLKNEIWLTVLGKKTRYFFVVYFVINRNS